MDPNLRVIRESVFSTMEYPTVFAFEENFDLEASITWFQSYWGIAVLASVLYVYLVFAGRRWMATRDPFDLRGVLTIWSTILAVFSWYGSLRLWRDFLYFLDQSRWDLKAGMCDPGFYRGVAGYWIWLFVVSKLFELGDTLFVVLRKQNFTFLHWFHHISALTVSWYTYSGFAASTRYFILMNFSIHALMYTYYALKASRIWRPPKWVSMCLTGLQLIQMLIGCYINASVYVIKGRGEFCWISYDILLLTSAMYVSQAILFGHFFYARYVGPMGKMRDEVKKSD